LSSRYLDWSLAISVRLHPQLLHHPPGIAESACKGRVRKE
jgi:hypothetical protein